MIATGSRISNKTEILDVINDETCSNLDEFPYEIREAAVGANLQGTPIVCGGSGFTGQVSDKCYKFTNGKWKEFTRMKKIRAYASGVVYKKKLHVFGGSDDETFRTTSEIISIDGVVSDGPELQTSVSGHAITTVDAKVSILSGGIQTSGSTNPNFYYAQTWYYNHEMQTFTSGPPLLEGRINHGSATIVDKKTKATIPVVTGGYTHVGFKIDSTEMLIGGLWQSGIMHHHKLGRPSLL